MPELPDVEKHRRFLAEHASGEVVRRVRVNDPELVEGASPQRLGRSIRGHAVEEPWRHGKWLVAPTDGGAALAVHFRMTGELTWRDAEADGGDGSVPAVELHFDHGVLGYRSRRRLGRVHLLPRGTTLEEVAGALGPDAEDIDRSELSEMLRRRRGSLKSALMEQSAIAGLGNELVDEILWRARLHPRTPAAGLDERTARELHRTMRTILTRSVRAGHVPSGPAWLNGRRGADDPRCPRCDAGLEVATVAGRTTLWCPREQPEPRR